MRRLIVLAFTLSALAACASYRETASPVIDKPILLAEFHEDGFIVGKVDNPLSVADWELRFGGDGSVEQRIYDQKIAAWRYFQGKPVLPSDLQDLVRACATLPRARPGETAVVLGAVATDTTYLHIVLRAAEDGRDVFAYRNPGAVMNEQFLRVWRRIAQRRPVAITRSGG